MSPADGEHPPELLAHLAAERGWYDLATSHLFSWASVVRSEMVARVPEERRSGTWSRMRFSYYTRDARDRDYTVIWRESRNDFASPGAESSAEEASNDDFAGVTGPEVVLDVNTLDAGTGYLDLGLSIVSPDEHLLAYSVDTSGNEVFTLRFRDLRTGVDLPDVVEGVGYTGAWTSDSSGNLGFLYTVPDASWRHERVRAHRLGDAVAADVDVLVEPDRRYEVSVRRCRSEQAIVVLSECRDTSEAWYVDPTGADLGPRSLGGRRTGVMYRAEHVRRRRLPPGHRRRRGRVPAGVLCGPRTGRAGPLGLARGAARGPGRAAGARRRVRRVRRRDTASRRRPDAARADRRRPGRSRHRRPEPLRRR